MKFAFTLSLSCLTFAALAQYSVGVSAGASIPRLHYRNTFERSADFVAVPRMFSSISVQRLINSDAGTRDKKMLVRAGVDLSLKYYQLDQQDAGIVSSFKMNYAGLGCHTQIQANTNQWLNPYASLGIGVDFLSSAIQTRGLEQYNLANDLQKRNYRADLEGGLMLDVLDFGYSTFGVGYSRGISNIETGNGEFARLSAWRATASIYIVINKPTNQ